jgi:hypothetical protein
MDRATTAVPRVECPTGRSGPQREYGKPMHHTSLLTAVALAATLLVGDAAAEHEADHRYVVRGFVLDAEENALADVPVTVYREERAVARARTDRQGYYSAHAHLHDEDIGRALRVRAGERSATISMNATRGDQSTEREHHVNFVGDRVVEGELGGLRFPSWVYTSATIATLLVVAAFLAQRVSRARKRARRSQQQAASGSGTRPGKSRRRKRHR